MYRIKYLIPNDVIEFYQWFNIDNYNDFINKSINNITFFNYDYTKYLERIENGI